MVDRFNSLFEEVALAVDKRLGGSSASSSHASVTNFDPDSLYLSTSVLVPNITNPAVRKGMEDPLMWWISSSIFTDLYVKMGWLIDVEGEVDKFFDNIGDKLTDIGDAFEENITNGIDEFNEATDEFFSTVEEDYKSVIEDLTHAIMVSQSTITQLTADYSDAIENAQRQMSEFYAFTERQWQATNAVIAQLLLRNADLEESMLEMEQFFAGQSAKTNDVIMNLTSNLADVLDSDQFWKNVLQDGKVADEPLTFSSFFGNDMPKIWLWVFVAIGIVIVMVVVFAVLRARKNRAGGTQQKS
jgi:glycosidase